MSSENARSGHPEKKVFFKRPSSFCLFVCWFLFNLPGSGQLNGEGAFRTGQPLITREFQSSLAQGDTIAPEGKLRAKWNMSHSPLRATVYSAILPGTGQIYNRKFWKLPIVYGGMGLCTYFIVRNTREYHKWRDAYVAAFDGNPATVPRFDPARYRLDFAQETYRRYTEISYLCLIGVYVLQVIDANVDGHLFYFDVSPDLSARFHPSLIQTGYITPALGLTLRL